jgi:hypothetical protein
MAELNLVTPAVLGADGKEHRQYKKVSVEEFEAIRAELEARKAAQTPATPAPVAAPVAASDPLTARLDRLEALITSLAAAPAPKAQSTKRAANPGKEGVTLVSFVAEGGVRYATFSDKPSARIRSFLGKMGLMGRWNKDHQAWQFGRSVTEKDILEVLADTNAK